METWKEAAQQYFAEQDPRPSPDQMLVTVREFETFLKSRKGSVARNLLRASDRQILLAENPDGGASGGTLHCLTAEGLCIVFVDRGNRGQKGAMVLAFASGMDRQELTANDAVQAACAPKTGRCPTPHAFMVWLTGELTKIADAAPK